MSGLIQKHLRVPKKIGEAMGREELAKRVLEIAKEIVADGSYKRAIKGAGQLRLIALACGWDTYWDEKQHDGLYNEFWFLTGKNNIEVG